MSGIYGFSSAVEESPERRRARLNILERRNRIYGAQGSESELIPDGALGCHLERFSEAHAADRPILRDGEIVFAAIDALIFNREECLRYLAADGDVQAQDAAMFSDERLVLDIYRRYGNEGLKRVNGDFAGAIWNAQTRKWTLFRDHLGVRPLFFYLDERVFAFSTDIRGLTAMPGADKSVDETELYLQLTMQNTLDQRRTDFARIQCVPAGHVLHASPGDAFALSEQCYWRPGAHKVRLRGGETAYQTELRRLVTVAIARRMEAVPGKIGVELSGGLDSSVISVIAHRINPQTVCVCWSDDPVEYPMQEGDVRENVEAICRQEGMGCKYLSFDGMSEEYCRRTLSADPPVPPYINTLEIGEAARYFRAQGARAALSGQGGDEGCSHRGGVLELYHQHEYFRFLSESFRSTKGRSFRLPRAVFNMLRVVFVQYPAAKKPWCSDNNNGIKMLNQAFSLAKSAQVQSSVFWFRLAPERYIGQGAERDRTETTAVLAAENGGRYLFPYLDYSLIDFAVSIPRYLYRHGPLNRYIYRKAFRDLLPEEMYEYTNKSDMGAKPILFETRREIIIDWFRSCTDLLNERDWAPYLDFVEIRRMIAALASDKNRISESNVEGYADMANNLFRCVLIQRLQEESRAQINGRPVPD